MKHGYLVDPAAAANGTRRIPGAFAGFQKQKKLGAGRWQWTGSAGGAFLEQQEETGRFYEGTDGGTYFVPDGGPVDELASAVAFWPPGTTAAAPGEQQLLASDEDEVLVEEVIRPDGKAAFLVRFAAAGKAAGSAADISAMLERRGMTLEDIDANGGLTGTARLQDGREVRFSGLELTLVKAGCPRCAGADQ